MSDNDVQLELKKRARRRLVGAIALAVLAAIALPMVMDQEPKAPMQDIQVRIPGQDGGSFTSRILPLKPGATSTPLPPTPAPAKPAEKEAKMEASPVAGAGVEPVRPEPAKPAVMKPEAAKSEPTKPAVAPKPEAKVPEVRAVATVEEKLPAKSAEKVAEKPVEKAVEKASVKPGVNGGEQWIVQIGAYRDPANVRNLQAKVKEQGYNFYTEPLTTDGITKTRVRAGPFGSREAADRARDRLKRIGVDGVVAPRQ